MEPPSLPSDQAAAMTGGSILLLDDDRDAAEIMRHTLLKAGFRGALKTMRSGAEAIQFLETLPAGEAVPNLMFIDLSLPDSHGFDVVRAIRAHRGGSRSFIAVMSASNHEADIDGAFSMGANAYLEKYPSVGDLVRLRNALEHGRSGDERLCFLRK